MNERVGLVRDGTGLKEAQEQIQKLKERYQRLRVRNSSRIYNYDLTTYLEVGSMLTLAEAVTLYAQARNESRGAHRRGDFPEADNNNGKSHRTVRLVQGSPQVEKKPVAS
jgi:succinate dehydrogenase/fumarate reductase flavoprotein subunit